MKLILTNEVTGLGEPGDVVEVKGGYGRNYLIPRGLAMRWTRGAEKQIDLIRRARSARAIRSQDDARSAAGNLAKVPVQIRVRAGAAGRLFGSVSASDIADAVRAAGGPELDRRRIEERYGLQVEQIYQATEGLLGISCERGLIHLNEPFILVEPEWQDTAHSRFVPVITDLRRRSQPVIRYRLNDVLRTATGSCACGRAALALAGVDGRRDDVLWLKGAAALVPIFPDVLARTILRAVEDLHDFEVQELAPDHWRLGLEPKPPPPVVTRFMLDCAAMVRSLGAEPPRIDVTGIELRSLTHKQRRIRGCGLLRCAS